MNYLFPASIIQIFCKAPVPGEVKTRLISHLGEDGAASLHERLARDTIALCQKARLAPMEIWCAPDSAHDFFDDVTDESTSVFEQQGSDLGERLAHAAASALERRRPQDRPRADSVIIIGTDCPALDAAYLRVALEKLQDHDAVIGPAEDGGYCLIGLKQISDDRHRQLHRDKCEWDTAVWNEVFRNIAWGSDTVCADTCQALNREKFNWALLPLLWDVDRPEDVARLKLLD